MLPKYTYTEQEEPRLYFCHNSYTVLGVMVLKIFCEMFSCVFPFLAWTAWQLRYWPNGLWNIYETFNQTFFTT